MIPKQGKDNYTIPKAYRPISLLSCLGKGLERLIARRMAWTIVELGILAPQHFGALPKRSATDLTAALTHDIEQALAQSMVATLVTADVEGAFDAVLAGRLVVRMREQGWPMFLTRLVQSFMAGRSAFVRFEGVVTDTEPLSCGLPQGSPASPVLYMLYTEPILAKLGVRRRRFGYADDIAIVTFGRTLAQTAAAATEQLQELLQWGADNAIDFDPAKTEVMHFSRQKSSDNPGVRHGVHVKIAKASLRWLGVYFDRKLTFINHVLHWTKKAGKVVNHLRGLCNTARGMPVPSVRRAVLTCVMPVLTYGLEAWYPGTKRTTRTGAEVNCGVQAHLRRMDAVLRNAARAILPVYKTTPSHILNFEAQIPPAKLLVEATRRRHGFRLGRLDSRHPLVRRLALQSRKEPTRLQRCYQLVPDFPRPSVHKATASRGQGQGGREIQKVAPRAGCKGRSGDLL